MLVRHYRAKVRLIRLRIIWKIYYTTKHSFDFSGTALSSTSNYMRNKIISAALDNIAKSATENMAKGLAKTSIGLIPIAGDIVVFFIDLGLDYSKEKAEAKQNLNEINQSIGALRDANYCNSLRLDAVAVSDGTAYQQVMIYPGSKTKNIIDNINDHFNAQDVAQYGLSYPITVEDALNNSSAVNDLLSGLSNSDFAYVTDPNH